MRVIRVVVSRPTFADILGAMRSWLDRNLPPLVKFETATEADAIWIRVQFDDDALADAFREHFGGTALG